MWIEGACSVGCWSIHVMQCVFLQLLCMHEQSPDQTSSFPNASHRGDVVFKCEPFLTGVRLFIGGVFTILELYVIDVFFLDFLTGFELILPQTRFSHVLFFFIPHVSSCFLTPLACINSASLIERSHSVPSRTRTAFSHSLLFMRSWAIRRYPIENIIFKVS